MYKKTDAIFSIYGKNGIIPWHFFEFSVRPFKVVEVEWKSRSNFWGLRPQNFAIIPDTFFLNSHLGFLRSLRSNENWPLNFEAATSKFWNHSWNFGFSPQKGKVDLCATNGSKVLIYLTLLHFIFYCTIVCNAKGNLAKSNKSEFWNRLSYRGLALSFWG